MRAACGADAGAMHNVKKLSQEKRAQKRLADVERARKYNALSRAAMARRSERIYDEESLVACEQVLSINPEMNTLWNFRREILAAMYPDGRDDARRKPCEREFRLTQECLGLNPKSYPVRSRSTRGVQCAPRLGLLGRHFSGRRRCALIARRPAARPAPNGRHGAD